MRAQNRRATTATNPRLPRVTERHSAPYSDDRKKSGSGVAELSRVGGQRTYHGAVGASRRLRFPTASGHCRRSFADALAPQCRYPSKITGKALIKLCVSERPSFLVK